MPPVFHFHKMQGAGNDFVVLDLLSQPLPSDFDFPRAALTLCDRRFGVGADGLLTLEAATEDCALRMRMWNPDGSEDMCGNGLRCIAALAWKQKHLEKTGFEVQTLAGKRQIEVIEPHFIRAAMGKPVFEPLRVPIELPNTLENALNIEIPVEDNVFRASSLSTGSTHTVIFLQAPLAEPDFQKYGPLLENHPFFPTRTSVMWAVADGENRFKIRIWERGAGETLACGTGACAVAVAAVQTERAKGPIEVESRGGILRVDWAPGREIFMTGPAKYVFEGVSKILHF